MWLITSWWAALICTAIYIYAENPKSYLLDWLCLMLWGLAGVVLIDHAIGYILEGGEFIEVTTGGHITSGLLLGITMLVPILFIWEIAALISRRKMKGG